MFNTTIYNSYKSEAERKNLCEIGNLKYCNDGKTIVFTTKYRNEEFVVSSSQHNTRQIGLVVSLCGTQPIHFSDSVDVRSQSLNNLIFAMNEILDKRTRE